MSGAMTPTMIGKDQPLCTCGATGEHSLFDHDTKITGEAFPRAIEKDLTGRHPSTVAILRWFDAGHLPAGPIREMSSIIANHAHYVAAVLPDDPELTVGLRKLLEAKDAFVRCAVASARSGQ